MKIKKIVCLVLVLVLVMATASITGHADEITIKLDDQKVDCPVPARIENGRTMVPMRAIFEAFGMEVTWNNDEKSVTATKGDDVIKLTVGEKTLLKNGDTVELDVAPYIANDTTLVPVRAVSESLDATVEWDNEKRQVEITTAEYEANKDKWKENTGAINVESSTVTGEGVAAEENKIVITKGGDFEVTGENDNMMIYVDTTEKVKLRLSGVKITNPEGPAIFFENSNKSLITISKGTENHVTDGAEYTVEAKAAIFSNDDIEIKGEGTLYVTSIAHHAIASDDDIKIEEGTLVLSAEAKDGIHANNTIKIQGGNITVTAKGDGIQAEEDVVIEGGEINVTTTGEVAQSMGGWGNFGGGMPQGGFGGRGNRGWRGQTDAENTRPQDGMPTEGQEAPQMGQMPEGMTPPTGQMPERPQGGMGQMPEGMTPPQMGQMPEGVVPPTGQMPQENMAADTTEDETTATKGIKATTNIEITGGKITVNAADHAIHSAATITISGGEMSVASTHGKGISAHGDVVIDGGTINVVNATEGLESKANFTINGGDITVKASDDGINAGGTDGRDVANRQNSEQATGHDLTITGGSIFVNAAGDGLDANGRMIITGGDIVVEGPTNSGNGSLDSGGVIKVDGGTLIALGASGMAETPDNDSAQPSFRLVTGSNIAANTLITITDSKGNEIYSYTTIKTGNSIVFSSDKLSIGETYTVKFGDTEQTVKMESNVTMVGGSGGFGGGFGGRGW